MHKKRFGKKAETKEEEQAEAAAVLQRSWKEKRASLTEAAPSGKPLSRKATRSIFTLHKKSTKEQLLSVKSTRPELMLSGGGTLHAGYLSKAGGGSKAGKSAKRWVVLSAEYLDFYKDERLGEKRGQIVLASTSVVIVGQTLQLTGDGGKGVVAQVTYLHQHQGQCQKHITRPCARLLTLP